MPKKFPALKAASAAFAGLLVLSGGLAASGALPGPLSPISATGADQTDASVAGQADVSTPAQPETTPVAETPEVTDVVGSPVGVDDDHETDGQDIDQAETGDTDQIGDNDQGDQNDQGSVSTPPAPAPVPPTVDDGNDQGAGDPGPVDTSAHPDNHGAAVSTVANQHDASDGTDHGAAVSAVAHQNAGHDDAGHNDEDSVSTPPAPAPAPSTIDNEDDQGEVDDQGGADLEGQHDGQPHGDGHDHRKGEDS